ncbi:hypothetical protein LCGC14_2319800 [marine sediment metagenome]|uniref:Uncharacterized protein n=1 Tax=marine sediment metagenome TaxID=412755 RepID=A0A0F9EVM0_9ZZZZ
MRYSAYVEKVSLMPEKELSLEYDKKSSLYVQNKSNPRSDATWQLGVVMKEYKKRENNP